MFEVWKRCEAYPGVHVAGLQSSDEDDKMAEHCGLKRMLNT
jgi:hypothetical protein